MAWKCVICGNNAGMTASRLNNGNGFICKDCLKAAGGLKDWMQIRQMSVDEIKARVGSSATAPAESSNKSLQNLFAQTKSVDKYILLDETNKKVKFPQVTMRNAMDNLLTKSADKEYAYSEIMGYEFIENDNSVTKGGLGSAVVGGALFGGVGAVTGGIVGKKTTVGTCQNMRVRVTLRNTETPIVMIDFLQSSVKTNSQQYLKAQEDAHKVMAILQNICDSNSQPIQTSSAADEIKKFKELLDMGAITQEEFEEQKNKLLR